MRFRNAVAVLYALLLAMAALSRGSRGRGRLSIRIPSRLEPSIRLLQPSLLRLRTSEHESRQMRLSVSRSIAPIQRNETSSIHRIQSSTSSKLESSCVAPQEPVIAQKMLASNNKRDRIAYAARDSSLALASIIFVVLVFC